MPVYNKTPISSGQTITSEFGNDVQTQHEKVVGTASGDVTQFLALIFPVDTRSTVITRTSGLITQIEEKDGSTVEMTTTINRTGGVISSIVQAGDGKTVTYTMNRTDAVITSITKGVV